MAGPIENVRPNTSQLPGRIKNAYVCWLDLMGTKPILLRSIEEYAIKMFKLHETTLRTKERTESDHGCPLTLYPVMDGVYVVSERKEPLKDFLSTAFLTFAKDVIEQEEPHFKFVVKGSVAYGPIIFGEDIPNEVSYGLEEYKSSLLLGIPMVQAFENERYAPPFGIYLDESARAFAPEDSNDSFNFVWWKWFHSDEENRELAAELAEELESYYSWCRANSIRIDYEEEKIDDHEKLALQYLPDPDAEEGPHQQSLDQYPLK